MLSLQFRNSNINYWYPSHQSSFGDNTQLHFKEQNPHDTNTYLSASCKRFAANPSAIRGLAGSNPFLALVSPQALRVSSEALAWRSLDARTLCVPTTVNSKHIFSAADTYALGHSLWTESLHSHCSVSSQLPVLPRGENPSRAGRSSPPGLQPRRHIPPRLRHGSAARLCGCRPTSGPAASAESQGGCFEPSRRGNSGRRPSPPRKPPLQHGHPLCPPSEPTRAFWRGKASRRRDAGEDTGPHRWLAAPGPQQGPRGAPQIGRRPSRLRHKKATGWAPPRGEKTLPPPPHWTWHHKKRR